MHSAAQSQDTDLSAPGSEGAGVQAVLDRPAFSRRLEELLENAGDPGRVALAAVLVLGVDRLANVRESIGFAAADDIAQRLGDRLLDAVPRSALVGRVGDDEFAVALTTARSAQDAGALARRIIEIVDSPIRIEHHDLRLIATVGIAQFPEDGRHADLLMTHAQAAMCYARERGTRLFEYFRDSIGQVGARRLRLESELRGAIDRGEFCVHYQPRRTLANRRIVGVEALLRWNHPDRGILVAADFIDVAVDTGLITPIGETVLRRACADAARWPGEVGVAVNLSTREYRGARLESIVERALVESGLPPERLLVELTEASLKHSNDETDVALVRLTALRNRGLRLVLDNFGAGAGCLDLLPRCRADYVKISSLFVRGLGTDDDATAIVQTIAHLSQRFGAAVIAEGIEQPVQLQAALEAGIAQGQGYLLGRPLPAQDMAELLREEGVVSR